MSYHSDLDLILIYEGDGRTGPSPEAGRFDKVMSMGQRLEASRGERNLKPARGGIVDIEFLVQAFQLKYGQLKPALRTACTWTALDALRSEGLLAAEDHAELRSAYDFLLRV